MESIGWMSYLDGRNAAALHNERLDAGQGLVEAVQAEEYVAGQVDDLQIVEVGQKPCGDVLDELVICQAQLAEGSWEPDKRIE